VPARGHAGRLEEEKTRGRGGRGSRRIGRVTEVRSKIPSEMFEGRDRRDTVGVGENDVAEGGKGDEHGKLFLSTYELEGSI